METVARLGDTSSHGGEIVSAAKKSMHEGKAIARVGDVFDCPAHGPNPILSGFRFFFVEGRQAARIGSVTQCGAVIRPCAAKPAVA